MIGRVVGQYKILETLGEGGMGSVYKAVDLMLDRPVAIKTVRCDWKGAPGAMERFRSEATLVARLNHPSICTVYSFFREGDEFFMVMELIEGKTLASLIKQSGAIAPARAIPIFERVLDGVECAHRMGIVHRDIKPANVLLTHAGAVKLTDFGIARVAGSPRQTRVGHFAGTIEYLAPECIRGEEPGIAADIYSLGIVLYEMLSGRLPFERSSDFEVMRAHLEVEPPSLHRLGVDVPPQLESVLARALGKEPAQRFRNAAEFGAALAINGNRAAAVAAGSGFGDQSSARWSPELMATRIAVQEPSAQASGIAARVHIRRHGRLQAAAGAGLILVAVAGLWLALGARRANESQRATQHATVPTLSAKPVEAEIPGGVSPPTPADDVATPPPAPDQPPPGNKKAVAERARRRAEALKALDLP
jgi:serine/threonine-protein kinase